MNYFTLTYRGVTVEVEPAHGINRWEMCLSDDSDWFPVGCGTFPQCDLETARCAALKRLKEEIWPAQKAFAYAERERLNRRISEMEST